LPWPRRCASDALATSLASSVSRLICFTVNEAAWARVSLRIFGGDGRRGLLPTWATAGSGRVPSPYDAPNAAANRPRRCSRSQFKRLIIRPTSHQLIGPDGVRVTSTAWSGAKCRWRTQTAMAIASAISSEGAAPLEHHSALSSGALPWDVQARMSSNRTWLIAPGVPVAASS
jgi:hypothetical protein